jgi:molybdopterin-guanine dinucleotide biosynthesis protein A
LLGAILAGGMATRFGSDKAQARLNGVRLIDHAAATLYPVVDETIICGRPGGADGIRTIPDRPVAGLGPLGGLCAALCFAADYRFDAVISIGCDTPFLPPALLDILIAARGAAYVREAPIVGRWPAATSASLHNHLLTNGDRSVYGWAAAIRAEPVGADGVLPNINSPGDLEQLKARWQR